MRAAPAVGVLLLLTHATMLGTTRASAQETSTKVQVNIWKPEKVEPTDERIKSLKLERGLKISKFAENMGNARMIAVADDGAVFITRPMEGDVVRLVDKDGDGHAEVRDTAASLAEVHGICLHEGLVFLATVREVYVCTLAANGELSMPRKFITDLPDGGQHFRRTMAFGPDGALYISIGSSCNACNETNPEHATIVRIAPENLPKRNGDSREELVPASRREVFASGLRNTLAFGWHPRTGDMWGVDQGIDDLGDDENAEEINRIVKGRNYGWPFVYEKDKWNPSAHLPAGKTKDAMLAANTGPTLTHDAHASPIAMVFVADAGRKRGAVVDRPMIKGEKAAGPWPKDMLDDALVTFRGSWNRRPPSGYELVRVKFKDGQPNKIERIVGDFLADGGKSHFGRVAGLAWAADGSLLMSDDTCGVVYRIWYPAGSDGSGDRPSGPVMGGG